MKRIIIRLKLIIIFTVFINCKGYDSFYKDSRLNFNIENSYSNHNLEIQNYFLCSHRRELRLSSPKFKNIEIDNDSIINLVIKNLLKLNLNIEVGEVKNISGDTFCHSQFIRIRDLKKINFEKLDVNSKGKRVLIPIIQIDDIFRFTAYITSNNVAGNAGFNNVTYVSFLPVIIENNKMIYVENIRYGSKGTTTHSREEAENLPIAYQVKEEHLEELVRRAMKRYIKRLKNEDNTK